MAAFAAATTAASVEDLFAIARVMGKDVLRIWGIPPAMLDAHPDLVWLVDNSDNPNIMRILREIRELAESDKLNGHTLQLVKDPAFNL
jgi:hypothetical protein